MRVKDLIEQLQRYDEDLEVWKKDVDGFEQINGIYGKVLLRKTPDSFRAIETDAISLNEKHCIMALAI